MTGEAMAMISVPPMPRDGEAGPDPEDGEAVSSRVALTGLTREALIAWMAEWGERPFRGHQIWSWLYVKLASGVQEMTDVSKVCRTRLEARVLPWRPEVAAHRISQDGTEKWLLRLADGQIIETVFIPEAERGTLCISCQVGCTLSCPFCHTGAQGFARNLSAAEIVEQVLLVRAALAPAGQRITNVVFMGMGEPLYNADAVIQAARILMDPHGLAIGTRKLTVSTAGVVPQLDRVGRELGVNLAISLHSASDAIRDQLVPLNRKYNLAALKAAVEAYPLKNRRRITWEYVLLDGVNDTDADARQLARYLRGIPSKINLIPFNPWPGSPFVPTPGERVVRFQEILCQGGYVTVIRDERGADINAACGQLKGHVLGARPRMLKDSGA
jgi:23S rRNA (adenine2503-C2)-methyltransferase